MCDAEKPIFVLDNGSCNIKAGFAGEDEPQNIIPTVIGRNIHKPYQISNDRKEVYVGNEAHQGKHALLNLEYPIQHGIVTNWDDMEKIWDHTFYEKFNMNPKEHPIILTEPPLNPKAQQERTVQIMFEKYETPGAYLAMAPVLSIYASGRGTAVSIHVGDGVADVLNIYEGHYNQHAVRRLDFAGSDLNRYLQKLLHERGYDFATTAELEIVRKIKEQLCYVALDYDYELDGTANERSFSLPDGNTITLGNEMFKCPEALFRPIQGLNCNGIQHLVHSHMKATAIDCHSDLSCNFVLSGGSTMFKGFPERMQKELEMLLPPISKVKVIAPPERLNSVWIGGSILGSLSVFYDMIISKTDYEEYGPCIVHRLN